MLHANGTVGRTASSYEQMLRQDGGLSLPSGSPANLQQDASYQPGYARIALAYMSRDTAYNLSKLTSLSC